MSVFLHVLAGHLFHRPGPCESTRLAVGDDVSHLHSASSYGKRANRCPWGFLEQLPAVEEVTLDVSSLARCFSSFSCTLVANPGQQQVMTPTPHSLLCVCVSMGKEDNKISLNQAAGWKL